MNLKEIETLLYIDVGAPSPTILVDEHRLNLLFYYNKDLGDIRISDPFPKERNVIQDSGVAVAYFKNVLIHKFGYPNDEVIIAHSYYSLGLKPYKMFELEGSDWLSEIEKMNRVHPYHNPKTFQLLKHFIITFKDSTFECIASGVDISFVNGSMHSVLEDIRW